MASDTLSVASMDQDSDIDVNDELDLGIRPPRQINPIVTHTGPEYIATTNRTAQKFQELLRARP